MFYYIKGKLVFAQQGIAVLDVGGVGYKMTVSLSTLGKIAGRDDDVLLYTHLAVREDGVELFGFYGTEEASLFKLLITVTGVGPRAAMGILSAFTPESFAVLVGCEDIKSISKANGIGPKTAARIVLELKDKIARQITSDKSSAGEEQPAGTKLSDAQSALMVLGYSKTDAAAALRQISPDAGLEEMIKDALKRLSKT